MRDAQIAEQKEEIESSGFVRLFHLCMSSSSFMHVIFTLYFTYLPSHVTVYYFENLVTTSQVCVNVFSLVPSSGFVSIDGEIPLL